MIIAVVGDSSYSVETANSAEITGGQLAQQGVTVICVDLTGIIEAVRRGAKLSENEI